MVPGEIKKLILKNRTHVEDLSHVRCSELENTQVSQHKLKSVRVFKVLSWTLYGRSSTDHRQTGKNKD